MFDVRYPYGIITRGSMEMATIRLRRHCANLVCGRKCRFRIQLCEVDDAFVQKYEREISKQDRISTRWSGLTEFTNAIEALFATQKVMYQFRIEMSVVRAGGGNVADVYDMGDNHVMDVDDDHDVMDIDMDPHESVDIQSLHLDDNASVEDATAWQAANAMTGLVEEGLVEDSTTGRAEDATANATAANATAANATAANATRLVEDAVQDGDVNACKWPCLVLLFVISLCL